MSTVWLRDDQPARSSSAAYRTHSSRRAGLRLSRTRLLISLRRCGRSGRKPERSSQRTRAAPSTRSPAGEASSVCRCRFQKLRLQPGSSTSAAEKRAGASSSMRGSQSRSSGRAPARAPSSEPNVSSRTSDHHVRKPSAAPPPSTPTIALGDASFPLELSLGRLEPVVGHVLARTRHKHNTALLEPSRDRIEPVEYPGTGRQMEHAPSVSRVLGKHPWQQQGEQIPFLVSHDELLLEPEHLRQRTHSGSLASGSIRPLTADQHDLVLPVGLGALHRGREDPRLRHQRRRGQREELHAGHRSTRCLGFGHAGGGSRSSIVARAAGAIATTA